MPQTTLGDSNGPAGGGGPLASSDMVSCSASPVRVHRPSPEPPPGWRPRLVAVDADGTIADPNGIVPPALVAKLQSIAAQGVPVVVDTGRSWLSAQMILDQLKLPQSYCVFNNGASLATYPPRRLLRTLTFDITPIAEILHDHPTVIFAVEDFGRGYWVSRPFPPGIYDLHGELTVIRLEDLAARQAARLILRDPVASTEDFADMMAQLDLSGLSWALGGPNWLDIASGQADKAQGLAEVARHLGIDQADVLALGDSYNDMSMLAWAGRGVVLAEAPAEVRAVADAVTGPFAAGGTLAELDRWFD